LLTLTGFAEYAWRNFNGRSDGHVGPSEYRRDDGGHNARGECNSDAAPCPLDSYRGFVIMVKVGEVLRRSCIAAPLAFVALLY
jgi:hypothetical protein